jgi:gliding motility-associated-like protein
MRLLPLFFLFLFTISAESACSQLSVQSDQTVEWYVQNVLLGSGVVASNITFNGQPADEVNLQCGYFQSNGSYMDIESGLVLSTGHVLGENFLGDSVIVGEESISVTNPSGGDPDLEALANDPINDHAVLEFDFIPTGDTLRFNYVFGSEEYPEYVNSFNDAFGFFLAGPGISGPFSSPAGFPDGSVNIALIPETTTPVTIDNVNNGDGDCFFGGPTGPCTNCEYYVDNCDIEDEALDGTTTVLEAFAIVQCGQTYHIKLAIGDAVDTAFDSAVFLEEGSFQSDLVITADLFSSLGSVNDGYLFENCGSTTIQFSRQNGLEATANVVLEISGVAENGVDFTYIPESFEFPIGDSTYTLEISAIVDNLPEGIEEATLTITNNSTSVCGGNVAVTSETIFQVVDNPDPLELSTVDHDIDCGDEVELTAEVTGGYGQYDFTWSNGVQLQDQTVSPGVSTDYVITVTDTCNAGSLIDTVSVTVPVYGPVDVELDESIELTCLENINISPISVTGGNGEYSYAWVQNDEVLGESATLAYQATSTNVLTLIVQDGCQTEASDNMSVYVPIIPILLTTSSDTVICNGGSAVLSAMVSGGEPPYNILWSSNGETGTQLLAEPRESSLYTIQVSDLCENTESADILVGVSETNAIFNLEETGYYAIDLTNFSEGILSDTLIYHWDFGDGNFSSEESPFHTYFDLDDHTISLTVTNEYGCEDSTSISIQAPPTIFIPTSFSPNNDGINDLFEIYAEGVVEYKLIIFDRWGQEVFSTDDVNESWNGRARQKSKYYGENDSYVYHLRARMEDGQRVDTRGVITMVR